LKRSKRPNALTVSRIDVKFLEGACTKTAYLANVKTTSVTDQTNGAELAAILMFFVEPSGAWFKA
jgi:hypothetical protein